MSVGDMLIVALGLLIGWSIVSMVYSRSASRQLQRLGRRELSDKEISDTWPAILRIPRSADPKDIDAAYQRRLQALRQAYPAVMTDVETRGFALGTSMLQRIRAIAIGNGTARGS